MNSYRAQRCLTRWVADSEAALEVAELQSVITRIQSALHDIPQSQRTYIANALLNLAVAKMIKQEGRPRTSTLLLRLGDVVGSSEAPSPQSAIDLSRTDA
jgi:hypothetical protein